MGGRPGRPGNKPLLTLRVDRYFGHEGKDRQLDNLLEIDMQLTMLMSDVPTRRDLQLELRELARFKGLATKSQQPEQRSYSP